MDLARAKDAHRETAPSSIGRKTELVARQRARHECSPDRCLGAGQLAAKLDDHASIYRHRPKSHCLRRSQRPIACPSSNHGEVRILAKTREAMFPGISRLERFTDHGDLSSHRRLTLIWCA